MIKPTDWKGKDLIGWWEFTIKIDGVRALWNPKKKAWMSRKDKPLYNIPVPGDITKPHDCELYLGSLKDSVRACRTQTLKDDTPIIFEQHLHSLDPLDARLKWGRFNNPNKEFILDQLAGVTEQGYEGLVLRQGDKWVKVKPETTKDVLITDVIEGEGKRKGHVGRFMTKFGKVGGFRGIPYSTLKGWWEAHVKGEKVWEADGLLVGATIEVASMGMTPDGKFRHPRFIRFRFDKKAEE